MPSFITPQNGVDDVAAENIAQLTEDFQGLRNIPISLTGINDPAAYALVIKNIGTGSKGLQILAADGVTVLLQVDANGTVIPASSVGTAQLAAGAVTNAKLAADVARANLLTNGGFEIWQRGIGPYGAGANSADRWGVQPLGTDTLSVSKNSVNADVGSGACAAVTFVLGTGAGTSNIYQQLTAAADYLQLFGRTISLSIRVRTATANAVRLGYFNGSTWVYSAFHSGGGAYETLTLPGVLLPSSAAYMLVSVVFSASCTAYLDNANLVVGAAAADYVPLHPAEDLARCLRYYEIIGNDAEWIHNAYNAAGTLIYLTTPYKAVKPVTPTITKVGTFGVFNFSQPAAEIPGKSEFRSNGTVTALGNAYAISAANAYWTVESNP